MLDLPNVTIVTIDGVGNEPRCLKALNYSCKNINFSAKKYLSPVNFNKKNDIQYIEIPKLSYDDYSEFCLIELHKYIDTDYVLIVHDDGFVLNSKQWNSINLSYDYIGAMWPQDHLFYNTQRWPTVHKKLIESNLSFLVGNGGFCLRSKKLMKKVADIYSKNYYKIPEDVVICILLRKQLEEEGFKFATYDVASQFSCESIFLHDRTLTPEQTFGVHGGDTHKKYMKLLDDVEI